MEMQVKVQEMTRANQVKYRTMQQEYDQRKKNSSLDNMKIPNQLRIKKTIKNE